MITLPIDATNEQIREIVVEWSELLAAERYREALEIIPHSNEELYWTPEALEKVIAGYGVIDGDAETQAYLLAEHGVDRFVVTGLLEREDRDQIIAKIDVDRDHLFGLDPTQYLGMVHYEDVPLSGFRSDLTARFHIKRVGENQLTLEFLDIHVM